MSDGEFDRAVQALRPKLVRNAYRFVENWDDAEDIAQEILLYAWTRRDTVRDLTGFLFASVRSRSFNLIKRRKAQPLSYDAHFEGEAAAVECSEPEGDYLHALEVSEAWSVFNRTSLTECQRERFWLHICEGHTMKEVGALKGCHETAVFQSVHSAAKKMQREAQWATS